ncbi:MAG TPA: serine/threonine-protein kinase [Terriglobales bacterium]|nr:serine/threonine-protein kinase [Terriglobales bacterium]
MRNKLQAALELEPARRSAYLDEIAADDPELRRELESLLASQEQTSTDSHDLPVPKVTALPSVNQRDLIGRRLGPYQIVRQIGIGGMGEVYRAFRADDQYRKEVAVKLVRAGHDSGFVLNRFKNERQVLASLEHPNIARLLDGGTTEEGAPYFVMELIDGQSIDVYCDTHRLSTTERLKLFLQVCSAVQYAHQRLIVHRDIKPGNILVNAEGVPKLLDFGIAKLLDAEAQPEALEPTVTVFRLLTPYYASPEQVKGEPITTSSDIYSLGVVLYELLTGHRLYAVSGRTPHEIARAVCESQPEKPSTVVRTTKSPAGGEKVTPLVVSAVRDGSPEKLVKRLNGDLDNIVLMALRKEPQRRYVSVEQFAEDIRRHLEDLPVSARQDTLRYRTSKFVARHTAAVLAATVAALALLAGLAVTLHEARIAREQARVAQQQRARAEQRFNDVRKLANSLMFEVHDSIKDLPGSTPARKLLVGRALEYLDSLSREAKSDASLQRELAAAYEKIGDVQGQPRQANLGDPVGAAASYRKALAIRESLATADSADLEVRRQLIPNYGKLSDLLWSTGDSSAMEYSAKGFALAEALYHADPANPADRIMFAAYRMDRGYKQVVVAGDRMSGLENLRQGSVMLEQMASEDSQNLRVRRLLGLSYSRTAEILQDEPGDRPRALALYKKAIITKQALVAADPTNSDFRRLVAYDQFAMGELLANMNDARGALTQDREALSTFQTLASADPANAQFQQDIGRVRGQIGQILTQSGEPSQAVEQLRLSLSTLEKLPDAKNPQSLVGFAVITDELWLGKAHVLLASSETTSSQMSAEHCREAESWFGKCLPAFQSVRDHAPSRYEGAERVSEIKVETARCEQILHSPRTR